MQLVENSQVSLDTLREISKKMYGGFAKAVVDIERELMVIDAEMHADQEEFLLKNGSAQQTIAYSCDFFC